MKRAPILGTYLCQLLILALLGYGLDLGCLIRIDGCDDGGACCASCGVPAHLDKAEHPVHIKVGPALLPMETLTLTSTAATVHALLPLFEAQAHPRLADLAQRDPVRGPPLAG